jgi:large subunit ribosomal protein L10
MTMTKQTKTSEITDLQARFAKAAAAVVADYQGMDVETVTKLRKALRKAQVSYFVSKNTLTRKAIANTPFAGMKDHLKGINSIGLIDKDPVALAKAFEDFAKDEEKLKVRYGFLAQGSKMLTPAEVKVLSQLPSREVLLAKIAFLLKSQHSKFVMVLNEVLTKFVRSVEAVRVKKEAQNS